MRHAMIDWTFLVRSLNCAGMTQRQIAAYAGMSFSAVQKLSMGLHRQPREFTACLRLLDLHLDVCPGAHKELALGQPLPEGWR